MKRVTFFCLLLWTSFQTTAQETADIFPDLSGEALASAVQRSYRPAEVLTYGAARDTLYAIIDRLGDSVDCFYTGYSHPLPIGVDPSKYLYNDNDPNGINCEHAWPQSYGTKSGPPKSDMHHLFPVRIAVNQARGNHPYGEVDDTETRTWYYKGIVQDRIPPPTLRDAYAELGPDLFEPRESVKGDVARALFYIYIIYPEYVEADFLQQQIETLVFWHYEDPADEREIARTWQIAHYQSGRPNPFVLDPTLVTRLFDGI